MSRILNRPMFRGGGKVSSYGTGIASGLTNQPQRYARGGSIHTPKRGIVKGPGSYSYADNFKNINWKNTGAEVVKKAKDKVATSKNFLSNLIPKGKNLESKIVQGSKNLWKKVPKKGLIDVANKQLPNVMKYGVKPSVGITAAFAPTSIIGESNRPKTYAALEYMKSMNQSGAFDETAMEGEYEAFTEEFDRLNDVTKYTPIPDKRGWFNKYVNPMGFVTGLNPDDKTAEEINKIIAGDENKNNPDDPPPPPLIPDAPPPLTMKEQVAKDKELFAELLGEGEARGKDVSDMLLRFAGSGGNTVGEKFQQYIGAEAMAGPSRTEKINQAAASLAINDYIAGKRSKENMEMMLEKTKFGVDYTLDAQKAAKDIKGMDFQEALSFYSENIFKGKKGRMDPQVIKGVLSIQMPGKQINTKTFSKKSKNEVAGLDAIEFFEGINIVTYKGGKMLVERVGDILTEVPDLFIT